MIRRVKRWLRRREARRLREEAAFCEGFEGAALTEADLAANQRMAEWLRRRAALLENKR